MGNPLKRLRMLSLTTLSLEIILIIILSAPPATGGRIGLPESRHQRRTIDRRRAPGEVPVINGIIGGSPPGMDDLIDDQTDPVDRPRVYKNLLSHNDTAPVATNSSVQITATPSICPGQPASVTGYISLDPSRSLFFWFLEASDLIILMMNIGLHHIFETAQSRPIPADTLAQRRSRFKFNDRSVKFLVSKHHRSYIASFMEDSYALHDYISRLFQENGPCKIKLDSTGLDSNPEAWNENANMIYVDQPVGTGYSFGTRTAKSTSEAMNDLYESIQLLLAHPLFAKFVGRPFGVWTESYGGHYAPVLVNLILEMNAQLEHSKQPGKVPIPVSSMGIGNGLTNPLVQYLAYITYAQSNPYNQSMVSKEMIQAASKDYSTPTTGCRDLIKACQSSLKAASCRQAQSFCNRKILSPLAGDRDVYDVRQVASNPYPPDLVPILNDLKFKSMIGVSPTLNWTESNEDVYNDFFSRLYAGDADYIVNYQGVEALVTSLNTSSSQSFANQSFTDWVVDGEVAGNCKTAGSLSYLKIFEAGHEVPAYGKGKLGVGRAAKVFFDQTNDGRSICVPPNGGDSNLRQNNSNSPRDTLSATSALSRSFSSALFPLLACLYLAL
ncbi:hypothetical protein PtB15_18B50 [Puccinia triticina]|nr:hypothetical protein PtB15_18B50 [Puccinia triticina]